MLPHDQSTERKAVLGGAVEVNTLGKALADLIAALKSKEPAATSDDVGRDLSSVQALQKKNNDLARDVSALAEKAKVLNVDVDGENVPSTGMVRVMSAV